MTTTPDPESAAREEASRISAMGDAAVYSSLNRVLAEAPHLERDAVIEGVAAFHADRLSRVPSKAKYPESPPWVDYVLTFERRVRELAGVDETQMALMRSLGVYLAFRGTRRFAAASPSRDERCRIAYVPDTDRGRAHLKNVDDPITHWRKRPPYDGFPDEPLTWDGVGSGLHIDDEPEEIFPLPAREMCMTTCDDVPGAVDFLSRYAPFWGNANVLLYDRQGRSIAIEKCSYNHMQIHEPDARGRSHVSGMSCRDRDSDIAKYQTARRREYLDLTGMPADGSDATFWAGALKLEDRLAEFLHADRDLTADALAGFFTRPRSEGGLNKDGDKVHPDEPVTGYTLLTSMHLLDERMIYRWQRDPRTTRMADEPEVYSF